VSLSKAIEEMTRSDGIVWLVDRNGKLAALNVRDYARMPVEWLKDSHVFMTLASALQFAATRHLTAG
jgi:hypothetical protein